MARSFFEEGLRFECQPNCGACCAQPGDVFVNRDEIRRLAAFKELSTNQFRRQFVVRDHGVFRLKEREDGGCIFLSSESKCTVYEVRPQQCRTYPFWPEFLSSRQAWDWEAIKCPGIGQGELIPASAIRRLRENSKE